MPDLHQTEAEPAESLVIAGEAAVEAVEALRESGLVDFGRIAVIGNGCGGNGCGGNSYGGNSYGGYTTLCLLVGSKLFGVGVAANGVYDLAFMATHGGWGWAEAGQGLMRATLWKNPERYRQNSPLYKLDHLDAPLLILQGGATRSWEAGPNRFSPRCKGWGSGASC